MSPSCKKKKDGAVAAITVPREGIFILVGGAIGIALCWGMINCDTPRPPIVEKDNFIARAFSDLSPPRARNLVFTSAGDNNDLMDNWIGPGMEYDVFVAYYGNSPERFLQYQRHCRWVAWHKGSKIGNFWEVLYVNHRHIFNQTEYFFMLDDDIWFSRGVADINAMFRTSRAYNLTLAMPSFDAETSRISWEITEHDPTPNILFSYVNKVEFNAPMLTRDAAAKTMEIYHPRIIGYGSPMLAVCANGNQSETAYAVVHSVVASNPARRASTGKRELELIPDYEKRREVWKEHAHEKGCDDKVPSRYIASVYVPRDAMNNNEDDGMLLPEERLLHIKHPDECKRRHLLSCLDILLTQATDDPAQRSIINQALLQTD